MKDFRSFIPAVCAAGAQTLGHHACGMVQSMNITNSVFGLTKDNKTVTLYCMENSSGASVSIMNYGCRLMNIIVPDKNGDLRDVCLGLENLDEYLADDASLGAIVGRVANRIAGGSFSLNDTEYPIAVNNGPNHLHGGPTGFGQRIWDAVVKDNKLVFSRLSADGEEGYPGNLGLSVTYAWSEDNELSITYEATTDQDTILNLTSHGYFNLNGQYSGTVLNHELRIDADYMTELDGTQIPTGKLLPVEGTPFDFREFKTIGQDIKASDPQLALAGQTYDHNLIIGGNGLREAAVLQSDKSGIRMTCFTDQPGIQIYSACYTLHQKGKNGIAYGPYTSVCLETQHFPDSIHHKEFPSVVLKKDEKFKSTTIYHFSTFS